MSISWGRTQRFKFTSGGALLVWRAPEIPAVYSITYKQDARNKPKSHTVFYFGESADLSKEEHSIGQILANWKSSGGIIDDLFVFIYPMPGSSQYDRSLVQRSLVNDYLPRANGY